MTPSTKQILTNPVYCTAFGFGLGLSPKAPGTFGSLLAIPLYWLMMDWHLALYLILLVGFTMLGVYICGETARAMHQHDHPGIVWDEVVGLLIAMLGLPSQDWRALLLGFVLFRFFDIVKPWPIRLIDRQVKGGFGIMLDDIVAGIMAALMGMLLWNYASIYQFLFF